MAESDPDVHKTSAPAEVTVNTQVVSPDGKIRGVEALGSCHNLT
jgi:hypothetical protein